jgi:hypothetical protein
MGRPPLPRPIHVLLALIVRSVLRPGKPAAPTPARTRLLTRRLAAVALIAQVSGIGTVQLAAMMTLTFPSVLLRVLLHSLMIRRRIMIREEDSCEEEPAEEEKKMLYVKLSEEHGEQERTPSSTRKLYHGFKTAVAPCESPR